MTYKDFNIGNWIGHISGAIEDERELDGNEMRDLVEFLTTLNQEPILDKIRAEIAEPTNASSNKDYDEGWEDAVKRDLRILDKYKAESEET